MGISALMVIKRFVCLYSVGSFRHMSVLRLCSLDPRNEIRSSVLE